MAAQLKGIIKRSPLRPVLQRRRLHAYCLGAPKTGTTSVSLMLRPVYRAEHEPLGAGTIDLVRAALQGAIPPAALTRQLRRRDRELYLEMESSHPMTVFAGPLAATFSNARFVLIYREPRSWLNSIINMRLERAQHRFDTEPRPHNIFWLVNEWFYRSRYPQHPPVERALAELGLYTLDGYLSGWALHHTLVLDNVPGDRLLVMELRDLSRNPEWIAAFLSIPPSALNPAGMHANRATRDHRVLEGLPQELLGEKIDQHCTAVLERLQRSRAECVARLTESAHAGG